MRSKAKVKRFGENCAQTDQVSKPRLRSALLNKLPKNPPTKLGAAVFALVVLHFVSQVIFFQGEKKTPEIEEVQSVEIKTGYEAKPPEITTMPSADIPTVVKPETETTTPVRQTVIKKKEPPRESKTERLRRAERILTGA